jgi:hypothetical protein
LGALSLCVLMFCDLQGHLGGKAKLNHIWLSYLWTHFRKNIHIARLVFYMRGRQHYVTPCARFSFFWIFSIPFDWIQIWVNFGGEGH